MHNIFQNQNQLYKKDKKFNKISGCASVKVEFQV